jgi:hypothetical protein
MGSQDGPRVGTASIQPISLRRHRGTDIWRADAPCLRRRRTRRAIHDCGRIRLSRTPTRTQRGFVIRALYPHAEPAWGTIQPLLRGKFRCKSPSGWGRASQRARTCHAPRAPPLAADVAQDVQRIPERDNTARRDRDGTEDDRAHVGPPPVLLARTTTAAGVPGGPPALPEARDIAAGTIVDRRIAVRRASDTRALTLRAATAAEVDSRFVPLLAVSLLCAVPILKQQPELGLLARAAVHAAVRVRGQLAPKPGGNQRDAGRGAVPSHQKLAVPYTALPPP